MRSIPLTLVWETLQHGRWGLLAAALGANLLPAILLAALRYDGVVDPGDASQVVIHMTLVQINMFIFGVAVFTAQGHPSRLYSYPVPTTTIVAWHMLPAMAAMAIEMVVSAAVLNAVFEVTWPLWGPALLAAVALASIQAAIWLTEKSAWVVVPITLVTTVLGLWFKSRYGATFSQPDRYWTEVEPSEILTLAAFAAAAYLVAVAAVARNRRGDPPRSLGIVAWLDRMFDFAFDAHLRLITPAQAQTWLEWRRKGAIMPGGVVFGIVLGLISWLMFSRRAADLVEGFVAGGWLLSVLGVVGGLVMGNSGSSDANSAMGSFLATRPMTNTQMARIILKTAAKSVFIAWCIWAAAFLALILILWAIGLPPAPLFPREVRWWYLPSTGIGPWITVSAMASFMLSGRTRPFLDLLLSLFAVFIALSLLSKFVLSREAQGQLVAGTMFAIAAAMVLGTAWAMVAAYRRGLIAAATVYVASSVWLVLCVLIAFDRSFHMRESLLPYALAVGIAAWFVAPLATAPLALAWNRNR